MLKKTITYTDYNDKQRTEDFYFNLSKAELVEMDFSEKGGLRNTLTRIVEEEDWQKIVETFKTLVLKAYGVKSEDGRRFIKNDQIAEDFAQTEAYSQLFMLLATEAGEAIKFINGIVPADLAEGISQPELPSSQ